MAAKKKVAKAAPAKKPATTPTANSRAKAVAEPMSKTQLLQALADDTGLTRKQVSSVLDSMAGIIEGHLKKRGGAGTFSLPGLFKIVTKHKPAQRARKGIHPITKEPTTFKAKPASVQVKIRPLKKLKDMAQ